MRDDSAELFFQSFLREALVSSSGNGQGCRLLAAAIRQLVLLKL